MKKKNETDFDFKEFESEAVKGLQSGASLFGEDGILKSLVKRLVDAALEGELEGHLVEEAAKKQPNKRNGYGRTKKLRTELGEIEVNSPRDRAGTFEPVTVGKWERQLGTGFEEQVRELYAMGNSLSDIRLHLKKMYGASLSEASLSAVTERVHAELKEWRERPLSGLYVLIYLDAIHFKIRHEGRVVNRAVYTIYGVDKEGYRDILTFWVGHNEGATEWGRYLEDLKSRGVEDVLFFAVDGLTGFPEVIERVFPQSIVQRCIVHMIRTSLIGVSDKDRKAVCRDLRKIYSAVDEERAKEELEAFDKKWDRYPFIARKWRASWMELTAFLTYGKELRRLIYTTNAVENIHRMMRKSTKTKAAWCNEKALEKQIYLSLMRKKESWSRRAFGWSAIVAELREEFGERFTKYLEN